jgi:hypothetical protein
MTPQHDDDRDRRLHDHLDREPHGADDRLADRPLEDDELLRRSVTTLRAMQEWLRESRPPAPPSLARAVIEQIEASAEIDNQTAGGPLSTSAVERGCHGLLERLRGLVPAGLTPSAALAAVLLLVLGASLLGLPDRWRVPHAGDGEVVVAARDGAAPPATVDGAAVDDGSELVSHAFRLVAPEASEVCLVGGFNRWSVCRTPLVRDHHGRWQATVALPPGRHEYMYVVDGEWLTDPEANLIVDDGFGNRNAVLFL